MTQISLLIIRKSVNIYILLFNNLDIINIHKHKINISKNLITYLINTTNQILAKSKEVIHIKILHGRDGDWIQCTSEEYEKNYTDKVNYAFIVDQDTNKGHYYKKVAIEVFDNEMSEIKNERMED